jgi:acyl transferase domain-containing protein
VVVLPTGQKGDSLSATAARDPQHRRLVEIDTEVEGVKAAFEEALAEVTSHPELDDSAQKRFADVGKRLADLKPQLETADLSLEQRATLYSALVDVNAAMSGEPGDLNRFEAALIGIERVRHVVRDALDEFVGGATADRRRLLHELTRSLPGVRQADIAELLAVDPRTIRRWAADPGDPDHRLQLVARLVAVLRHAWTPKGILAWFHRPRRDLDGLPPIDLLDDPGSERILMSSARSSRNQYST